MTYTSTAVELHGLTVRRGGRTVLDEVDLTIARGEIVALLGPNGAGKTTTVRVLSTLLPPTAGTATVLGHDVVHAAARVREVITLTGQDSAVDDRLTGRENLALMVRLHRLPRRDRGRRVAAMLDQVGLTDAADRLVSGYSGGMRRRLHLAASLLGEPQVLVLDEPTTGLDPRSRASLWAMVREAAAGGTTVLLTTQYLDEADQLADRVAVLDQGHIVALGTPSELKDRVGSHVVELDLADAQQLRIPTDGTVPDVRRVLGRVEEQHFPVTRWRLREPTLDEVFLELTGHHTTPAAQKAAR